jgi:hypothetical protein
MEGLKFTILGYDVLAYTLDFRAVLGQFQLVNSYMFNINLNLCIFKNVHVLGKETENQLIKKQNKMVQLEKLMFGPKILNLRSTKPRESKASGSLLTL